MILREIRARLRAVHAANGFYPANSFEIRVASILLK
jgi:hypothetical protein